MRLYDEQPAHYVRCLLERVIGKVRITCRCLDAAMAEKPSDQGQRHTGTDDEAGKAVSQIMDAHIVEAGRLAQSSPRLFQIDQMPAGVTPDYDIWIVHFTRQSRQDAESRRVEWNDFRAVPIRFVALEGDTGLVQI